VQFIAIKSFSFPGREVGEEFDPGDQFLEGVMFGQVDREKAALAVVAGEDDEAVADAGVAVLLALVAEDEVIDLQNLRQFLELLRRVAAAPDDFVDAAAGHQVLPPPLSVEDGKIEIVHCLEIRKRMRQPDPVPAPGGDGKCIEKVGDLVDDPPPGLGAEAGEDPFIKVGNTGRPALGDLAGGHLG